MLRQGIFEFVELCLVKYSGKLLNSFLVFIVSTAEKIGMTGGLAGNAAALVLSKLHGRFVTELMQGCMHCIYFRGNPQLRAWNLYLTKILQILLLEEPSFCISHMREV